MIASDFAKNGTKFMAIVYQDDLERNVLAYDQETGILRYSIGPIVNVNRVTKFGSPELSVIFGSEIISELTKFAESKNESSCDVCRVDGNPVGSVLYRD